MIKFVTKLIIRNQLLRIIYNHIKNQRKKIKALIIDGLFLELTHKIKSNQI